MTISRYIEALLEKESKTPGITKLSCEINEVWKNNGVLGYTILAGESLGLEEQEIGKLVRAMKTAMDEKTIEEAEKIYNNSYY